jgi:citrate synthase
MSTYVKADEAAAILDVSKPTLYAYVSRGRLRRSTGPDGRTSLFARDEVEQLAARSRRASAPRPTIDVQVSSGVTVIDEHALTYRGHDVAALAADHSFEDVAELLWAGPDTAPASGTKWPAVDPEDRGALAAVDELDLTPIGRLAVTAHVLGRRHPADGAGEAARRLLLAIPTVLGSSRRTGPYARRLAAAWRARPSEALVAAVDTSMVLLADHELATSTLAVRIAASVRSDPYVAFASGFASMEGTLHGKASAAVHRFLEECARDGADVTIRRLRAQRMPIPGFGHKVYRIVDPRYAVLVDHVGRIDPDGAGVLDSVVAEAGRVMAHPPNVDLALGALSWVAGLDPDIPIFAVARVAGWAAHYAEEVDERPVRFRGVARPLR